MTCNFFNLGHSQESESKAQVNCNMENRFQAWGKMWYLHPDLDPALGDEWVAETVSLTAGPCCLTVSPGSLGAMPKYTETELTKQRQNSHLSLLTYVWVDGPLVSLSLPAGPVAGGECRSAPSSWFHFLAADWLEVLPKSHVFTVTFWMEKSKSEWGQRRQKVFSRTSLCRKRVFFVDQG